MVRGKNSVRCRFRRAFYNPVKGASSTKFLTVPDHSGGKYALIKRLLASRFDCRKTVDTDTFQDRHHLSVPIMHAFKLPSNMLHGSWQNPIKEWCTVPQCSRFACQDRNIMPWIINCLATTKAAFMLAYRWVHLARADHPSAPEVACWQVTRTPRPRNLRGREAR